MRAAGAAFLHNAVANAKPAQWPLQVQRSFMPRRLMRALAALPRLSSLALSGLELPSAPAQPIEYMTEEDRPQPRLDRMRGVGRAAGMPSVIGRLRPCTLLDWKFTVLSHNTIRGAAGAALLNAELLHSQGKLVPASEPVAQAQA